MQIIQTNKFKRDLKRLKKQGFKMERLENIIKLLIQDTILPVGLRNHKLSCSGSYDGQRAVHVMPDCVMIYEQTDLLILKQIGSHTNIFDRNRKIAIR